MKWFLFTAACIVALIALGVLAVDQRDVIWEGRTPQCGYCRAELERFAVVCPDCRRSQDWYPHKETCRWCLDKADAERMEDILDELGVKEEPLPGALAEFPIGYFKAMDEGACTFCGGLGAVMEDGREVTCPVCFGDKHCIACGGDRVVVLGEEWAHKRALARAEARRRAERRSEITQLPVDYAVLLRRDVEAVRGHEQAEALSDARGRRLLDRARERVRRAFAALREEWEHRDRTGAG